MEWLCWKVVLHNTLLHAWSDDLIIGTSHWNCILELHVLNSISIYTNHCKWTKYMKPVQYCAGFIFCTFTVILFAWFDSLGPINNFSVIKGQVFLGWTSTKLRLMFLLKDTTQWRRWGSNKRPLGLESSTLPLSHCAPTFTVIVTTK